MHDPLFLGSIFSPDFNKFSHHPIPYFYSNSIEFDLPNKCKQSTNFVVSRVCFRSSSGKGRKLDLPTIMYFSSTTWGEGTNALCNSISVFLGFFFFLNFIRNKFEKTHIMESCPHSPEKILTRCHPINFYVKKKFLLLSVGPSPLRLVISCWRAKSWSTAPLPQHRITLFLVSLSFKSLH